MRKGVFRSDSSHSRNIPPPPKTTAMTTKRRDTLSKKFLFFTMLGLCLGFAIRCRRPDPEVKARVHACASLTNPDYSTCQSKQ